MSDFIIVVVEYLRTANLVTNEGKPARSSNSCVADDEQALLILMRCCFDVQKASQELAVCGPRSKGMKRPSLPGYYLRVNKTRQIYRYY